MHLCRGNFQSTFVASGGYEPVAESLSNEINIQAYFMEHDSDLLAGGFEAAALCPRTSPWCSVSLRRRSGNAGIQG